ncbi:hypothetical protein [Streptomyces canus]|uniref:hypothetical protein n=1 Tax=Streptomyces canus TaxID=58343 RepID=UPI0037181CF3
MDQAIGVLTAVHRLTPTAGFEMLPEVSQRTNIFGVLLTLTQPLRRRAVHAGDARL